jgi:hypothetical protein
MTITQLRSRPGRAVPRPRSLWWAALVVTVAAVTAILLTDPAADAIASQLNGLPSITTWSNLIVPLVLTGAAWAQIRTLLRAARSHFSRLFPDRQRFLTLDDHAGRRVS